MSSSSYDATMDLGMGLVRKGAMKIYYKTGEQKSIPMPLYEAGHSVTMRAPKELLDDVMQWYKVSPH
jgi:hypothetical protein